MSTEAPGSCVVLRCCIVHGATTCKGVLDPSARPQFEQCDLKESVRVPYCPHWQLGLSRRTISVAHRVCLAEQTAQMCTGDVPLS
eukprot:4460342-Amphidinium_carterae.1